MWHALAVLPVLGQNSDSVDVGWRPGRVLAPLPAEPVHVVLPDKLPWEIVQHGTPCTRTTELRGKIMLSVPATADAAEVRREMQRLGVSRAFVYNGSWIDDVHPHTYAGVLYDLPPDDPSVSVVELLDRVTRQQTVT